MFYTCLAAVILIDAAVLIYSFRRNKKLGVRRNSYVIRLMMGLLLIDMGILLLPYFFEMNILDQEVISETGTQELRLPWIIKVPFLIIQLLQSTTMDASYEIVLNLLMKSEKYSKTFIYIYLTAASTVSLLLPLSFILTITSAFYGRVSYYIACTPLSGWKKVYVFNEANDTVVSLINEIDQSEEGASVRYIFCEEKEDPAGKYEDDLGKLKVSYTRHGPYDILRSLRRFHKKTGEIYFLFLSGTEDKNAEHLICLQTNLSDHNDGLTSEEQPLADKTYAVTAISSSELGSLMNFEKPHVRTRIFNRNIETAYDLFLKYPLFIAWDGTEPQKDEKIHIRVMVLGKGIGVEEIIRSAAWMGSTSRTDVTVTYFGKDAGLLKKKFESQYPGLMDKEQGGGMDSVLFFEEKSLRDIDSRTLASFDYIVAAYKNDEKNIRTGMWIRMMCSREMQGRADHDQHKPFIAVRISDGSKARNLSNIRIQGKVNYELFPFGMEDQLFGKTSLLNNPVMKWMVMAQASYDLSRKEADIRPELLAQSEESLYTDTYSYMSTQANAVYIFTRLFDSGAADRILRQKGVKVNGRTVCELFRTAFPEAFTAKQQSGAGEEIEGTPVQLREEIYSMYNGILAENRDQLVRLSRAEHLRWNVCMAASGWVSMTEDGMKEYMKQHGGQHKDLAAQRHPCITSWENLARVSLIKNPSDSLLFIRYDMEMVMKLPWMLENMYR